MVLQRRKDRVELVLTYDAEDDAALVVLQPEELHQIGAGRSGADNADLQVGLKGLQIIGEEGAFSLLHDGNEKHQLFRRERAARLCG